MKWLRGKLKKPQVDVSIICLTYNHAPFIHQALDSFLSQEGVSFEVVVADDCSTDGTTDIVRKYSDKHPDLIKHVVRKNNLGAEENFTRACEELKGRYMAFCDGDDYFLTKDKLYKQVSLLDNDLSLSICCSAVRMIFENGEMTDAFLPDQSAVRGQSRFTIDELMRTNMIVTCSVMYRWMFHGQDLRKSIPRGILPGDYYLNLLHAKHGDIYYSDEVTAVYRRHSGGIWWHYGQNSDMQNLKHGLAEFKFHVEVKENIFSGDASEWYENNRVIPFGAVLLLLFAQHADIQKILKLRDLSPDTFKKSAGMLKFG